MNRYKITTILSITLTFILLSFGVYGCTDKMIKQSVDKPDEVQELADPPVDITVMNMGKADCILIQLQDKAIMIDTGLNKSGSDIVNRLQEKGINKLDLLILTHMDKDHIGGADTVIDNIEISNLIQADYIKENKQYSQYKESIEDKGITPVFLHETISTNINGTEINIYPAQKKYYEQSNDYSIIVELKYGRYNFLFAGDAEEERIKEFLNSNTTKYTFVKIPHHGRYNSMSKKFIKSVSPFYAAITCSE